MSFAEAKAGARRLGVQLVAIVSSAWIVKLVLEKSILSAPELTSIKFTPGHFGSPSLGILPNEMLIEVAAHYGSMTALTAVLLIFIFPVLAIFAAGRNDWLSGAHRLADSTRSGKTDRTASASRRAWYLMFVAGALMFVAAATFRIWTAVPVVNVHGGVGKAFLATDFIGGFTKALARKGVFDEKKYTEYMLDALKVDSELYFRFGSVEYWAYDSTTGKTSGTSRKKLTAAHLLEIDGKAELNPQVAETSIKFLLDAGYPEKADEIRGRSKSRK